MDHRHIEVKTEDGTNTHFLGIIDSTLCGLEISGDESIGIMPGKLTFDAVNCKQCIQIVKLCWELKKNEIAGNIII